MWNGFVSFPVCSLSCHSWVKSVVKGVKDTNLKQSIWMWYLVWVKAEWLTLYVNELFGHPEVPRIEGLIVGDVALSLWDGNDHVVPLLPVHLLSRDRPLEMVFLHKHKRQDLSCKCRFMWGLGEWCQVMWLNAKIIYHKTHWHHFKTLFWFISEQHIGPEFQSHQHVQ